jgi:hypothetical protein
MARFLQSFQAHSLFGAPPIRKKSTLRYALEYKDHSEPLDHFIKRKGGINECAARFVRRLGAVLFK